MCILPLPSALGFSVLSGIQPLGAGTTILDLSDMILSQILLPVGSIIMLLFCVFRRGWGWKSFTSEANSGKGLIFPESLRGYITYVLLVIVLVLLILGLM